MIDKQPATTNAEKPAAKPWLGFGGVKGELPSFDVGLLRAPRSDVPCDGCTVCCRGGEVVTLFPEAGDDPSTYLTKEAVMVDGTPLVMLQHKPNGDCVYLGESGCTIHDRAPAVCRTFDCRGFYLKLTRNERRVWMKQNEHKRRIFAAARARLHTLRP